MLYSTDGEINVTVVAEEGRDPLKFIVFISSTSLDARESIEYDNVQKEAWWYQKAKQTNHLRNVNNKA